MLVSIPRIPEVFDICVIELCEGHLVPDVIDVVGVVDTQHLLLIHPVGDPVEHIVHNPAVSDSDVTCSIFESICSPVEIVLAHIDKSVVKLVILHPVTVLQCLRVILVPDYEGGVGVLDLCWILPKLLIIFKQDQKWSIDAIPDS